MGLFQRNQKEERTIEDILTPKYVDDGEGEGADNVPNEGDNNAESVVEHTDDVKNEKVKKKEIQVESPEESNFNALNCFGWSETKTSKWLIKCAHFWYGAMSFFWFVFGALTFAPIIFMQKKVNVIFKDKLKSFIVSAIIYGIFLALLIFLLMSKSTPPA